MGADQYELFDPSDDPIIFQSSALTALPPVFATEAQLHLPPTLPSPPTEAQLQLPAVQSQAAADASSLAAQLTPAFPGMADFTLVGDPTLDDTLVGENGEGRFELVSKIAVGSTRDNPSPNPLDGFLTQEIYLINPDPDDLNPQRLTNNTYGDAFPMLSPDGKKIVFDSNRLTADPADSLTWNISDLFVMDTDGSNQTLLTRGSTASWSPDSKDIVFHASASYYESGGTAETVLPIRLLDPGAPTSDSDLFVANVDDLEAAQDVLTKTQLVTNITNTPDLIEHDADWSASTTTAPDGLIAFASLPITDNPNNSTNAEIYVINPDGTGLERLTFNNYEERAPSWSPDGTQIAFMARIGGNDFEICVMNADGSGFRQLTNNTVPDATPSWSPDGDLIAFFRGGVLAPQVIIMNPDTVVEVPLAGGFGGPQWGEVRTRVDPGDGADETLFAGSQADYSIQTLGGGSLLFADYLLA
jgi:TolB protein